MPGYRKTEIGVLPDDWDLKLLEEIGSVVRGGSPRPAGDPRYFGGNFIPWLTVASLTNIKEHQLYVTETAACLTEEGSKHSRILINGTMIIANSGATLGIAKLLGITCCANDGVAAITGQRTGIKEFICQYFNTTTKHLREVIATGNGQPNLNTGLIRKIAIPFPPISEQRAIATALSDVDALLNALDRLIAKKRDLKQAVMQQLLTGQTRLSGFSDEWELKRLGALSEMGSGGTPLSSIAAYYDGDIPWVSISDMTRGGKIIESTVRNLSPLGLANSAAQIFPIGTVLYAMYASLGECSIAGKAVCTSQAILGIRAKNTLNPEYLYYYLTSLKPIVKALGQQGTQSNLNKGMVQDFLLNLPSVAEQTAIAAVLSDIDNELANLELRRNKTSELKQGMMQELLTGRTRLV